MEELGPLFVHPGDHDSLYWLIPAAIALGGLCVASLGVLRGRLSAVTGFSGLIMVPCVAYLGDVGGGEAGYIAPHPTDPNIVYAGEYFGILTRWDKRTDQAQNISVWPDDTDGHEAANLKYRFNWNAPILVSRHNPEVIYHAGNQLLRSENRGRTWTEIEPRPHFDRRHDAAAQIEDARNLRRRQRHLRQTVWHEHVLNARNRQAEELLADHHRDVFGLSPTRLRSRLR